MDPHINHQVTFFNVESPLLKHSHNVASQNGEDGIIEHIFGLIPTTSDKHCVEFGAWDGKHLSNCYNLISNKGWHGLFIEANAKKFSQLLLNHGTNQKVVCLNRYVEFHGDNSLDHLIAQSLFPADFDLLSIDIDGADYFVWESLNNYLPKVVVIEFNPSIPNDVVFVQGKDMRLNQGASLLSLILLGKQKGYELICATACNAIFVRSEFYSLFQLRSNHITTLHPSAGGRIFHGYDSTIFTCGMPRLLWSGVDIKTEDLQVLPVSLRNFGDSQSR